MGALPAAGRQPSLAATALAFYGSNALAMLFFFLLVLDGEPRQ